MYSAAIMNSGPMDFDLGAFNRRFYKKVREFYLFSMLDYNLFNVHIEKNESKNL